MDPKLRFQRSRRFGPLPARGAWFVALAGAFLATAPTPARSAPDPLPFEIEEVGRGALDAPIGGPDRAGARVAPPSVTPDYANTALKDEFGDMNWVTRDGAIWAEFVVKDAQSVRMHFDYLRLYCTLRGVRWLVARDETNKIIGADRTYWRVPLRAEALGAQLSDVLEFDWEIRFSDCTLCFPKVNRVKNRVFVGEPLPSLPDLYPWDTHVHADGTDNPFEFGGTLETMAGAARSIGLSGFFITDHSCDVVQAEWDDLRARAARLAAPDLLILPGLELTVDSNDTDDVVEGRIHLLAAVDQLLPYPEVFATQNHSGRLTPLSEAMEAIHRSGGLALAAHPTDGFPFPIFGEMGRWSNANYEVALAYPEFVGLEFHNKRTSSFEQTSLNEQDKNPFPFVINPAWDAPWRAGMEAYLRLQQSHLDPLRRIAIAGGSDAHGDMNYTIHNKYGVYRLAANNSAFGKVFTSAYSPAGLTREGILDAFRNHAIVVSDGPAFMLWVDADGDGTPDGPVGGMFQLGAQPELILSGRTNHEFGYFKLARIIRVAQGGIDTLTIPLKTYRLDLRVPAGEKVNAGEGWVAVLVETETFRGHRAVTSPVYLTRPLGTVTASGVAEPATMRLSAPHPNPAVHAVTFTVTLPAEERVELAIHDVAGRTVATLHRGPLAAGEHTFMWRIGNPSAGAMRAGVYFIALRTANVTLTRKVGVMP